MNLGKLAKWTLGSAIIMVTLIVLLYSMVSFWGRREWANTQATLKAKGETLNIWSIAQPKLPEADNFFAAPLWKDLRASGDDGKEDLRIFGLKKALGSAVPKALKGSVKYKDPVSLENAANYFLENNLAPISGELPADTVLRRLSEADGIMAEIRSDAAARRGSRMTLDYDAGLAIPMPQLTYMMIAGQFLSVQGAAFAAKGEGEKAKEDLFLQIRLSEAFVTEPLAISQVVRLSILELACRSIWTGLENHCWNDAQLAQIENRLASISLREGFVISLRGDRALFGASIERYTRKGEMKSLLKSFLSTGGKADSLSTQLYLTFYPTGLMLADLSNICLTLQRAIDAANSNAHLLDIYTILDQGARHRSKLISPLSNITLATYAREAFRFEEVQIRIDEAVIACALERYLLRFGTYPDSLDKIPGLPNDSSSGKTFRYEVTPEGGYRLWSIGYDGKDDGGKPFDENARTGDWTWIIPGKR